MDIVQDGFGFMLAFGDLVWVPFVYSLQAFYLVSHPSPLTLPWLAAILTLNGRRSTCMEGQDAQKTAVLWCWSGSQCVWSCSCWIRDLQEGQLPEERLQEEPGPPQPRP